MVVSRWSPPVFYRAMLTSALLAMVPAPTRASTEGCGSEWRIAPAMRDECLNLVALAPGNDTRVNLLLLLLDHDGTPSAPGDVVAEPVLEWREFRKHFATTKDDGVPGAPAGEGSLCLSDEAGAAGFFAAVKAADDLSAPDRDALIHAREAIQSVCAGHHTDEASQDDLISLMRTRTGKAFATYLHGAAAFYQGRFNDAADDFALARKGSNPWLADAADYMVARTEVNRAQVGAFDAYGSFAGSEHVDQQAAATAQASLEDYLRKHPDGRYAKSARGLMRRVAWFAGWTGKLADQYAALLARPAAERGMDDLALVEEIDNKLLPDLKPGMTRDPILLAVLDLRSMRASADTKRDGGQATTISQSGLDAQRAAFASAVPLWEFLAAADAFYVEGASEPVVRSLRDETRRRDGDYVWFSRQFLRGLALEARDDRNTQGFWKELYPATNRSFEQPTIEFALALHDERHDDIKDVFAPGSLIRNAAMRRILIENVAGPSILRSLAHDGSGSRKERDVALFTLLRKELTHGLYADFLRDVSEAADDGSVGETTGPTPPSRDARLGIFATSDEAGDIACPPLKTIVAHLAQRPDAEQDRLCLAEFVRLNDSLLDATPAKGQLGGGPSMFPGRLLTRAAVYQAVIADAGAKVDDRAYALYRAVKCYEPTGINGCGGADVPKAGRKAWYYQLKREYPSSRWARDLPYWW